MRMSDTTKNVMAPQRRSPARARLARTWATSFSATARIKQRSRCGRDARAPRLAMKLPVYMDNHATTPVDPRVLEAMLPYFTENYGNAASRNHRLGWEAEAAVETARKQVAKLINASPQEIVFTSSATESDNLAIKGVAWAHRGEMNTIS